MKKYLSKLQRIVYNNRRQRLFENLIAGGEWTLKFPCNEEALIGNL